MEAEHDQDALDLAIDDEDALSFRDFPIHDLEPDAHSRDDDQCSRDELFEFCTELNQKTRFSPTEMKFCVKFVDEDYASTGRGFEARSESFIRNQRFGSSLRLFSSTATGSRGNLRRNLRKPKVLIGLVKAPEIMELSEIRRRQARRGPAPLIPVAVNCRDGDGGEWSLLRALRNRSILLRVLTKATSACIQCL